MRAQEVVGEEEVKEMKKDKARNVGGEMTVNIQ